MEIRDKELHRIAVTAIIYKPDRRYLITKRGEKKAFPGKWMVPGGGLSVDDYINEKPGLGGQWYNSLERGLAREVREEVGLTVGKPELLTDLTYVRRDGTPVLVLSYYAPHISGEAVVGEDDDTVDAAWVTLEEAKQYDLLEGLFHELEMVDTILSARR